MMNLKNLLIFPLSRALLALYLLAGAATASPVYHVALDTAGTSGDGFMQIDFLPFGTTDVLTATISGLDGAFTGTPDLVNVTQSGGAFTFSSDAFSEFFQSILLGGTFGFDVTFGGVPVNPGSTGLTVSLLDSAGGYLSFNAAQISLVAGEPPAVVVDPAFAAVNPVPEPADWLLVATGLMLLGAMRRRRA
ncbi:NF038129 family PEP-CTERM protein [Massilia putida]|uniref:NF038129 family PEP-CTERM protein n=1 Tax=Massilia putida TaxID=1141883 RepID=UPI000951B2C4|nr:NF038129 family PEP-CTERM protein [Massilia putida]